MPHLFVDNLTVIDCSLLDAKRGLIGASWIVDIELFGELDQQSMVFDFGHVKKRIKQIIDENVDHKLLVPQQYSQVNISSDSSSGSTTVTFTDELNQVIEHVSPDEALCLIDAEAITQQAVIDFLDWKIMSELPDNVEGLQLRFRQEDDYAFYYCYSHGLKKHDGNCQRIAHGHRSRIQIWENGDRSRTWENRWSDKWKDIYLGSVEDIVFDENDRIRFAYDAPQGHFELELDRDRVDLLESDSTVECIAEHIANTLKQAHPQSDIRVRAFEGVAKGAIANA